MTKNPIGFLIYFPVSTHAGDIIVVSLIVVVGIAVVKIDVERISRFSSKI